MSAPPKSDTPTPTSKPFTHLTDDSAFTDTHYFIDSTTVHVIQPPQSDPTSRPWITARQTTINHTDIFRHPLTSKPYSVPLSRYPDFEKLQPSTLTNSFSFSTTSASLDKLLPLPFPRYHFNISIAYYSVLVLYGGGELKGCAHNPRSVNLAGSGQRTWPWVRLTSRAENEKFDDIVEFEGKVYAVDRQGVMKLIHDCKSVKKIKIGRTVVFQPVLPGSGRFGWRKRFAVDGGVLYLVVRMEEERFRVYILRMRGKRGFWEVVRRFGGDKVVFMARDYCFFRRASRKFPGREYRNCIVFSEAAFPQYGNGCWEFTQSDDRQFSEDDIAVFRLGDEMFAREEESEKSGFPKIDWSPPDWIFNVSSFPADAFKKHSGSESSSSQSEREPDEEENLDSDSGDKNGEEVQSRLKDSKSKDEDKQEEMESDFGSLDPDQRWVECDSDSPDQEDEKMQCDSNSQEKEDKEMHSKEASTEVGASLQEDVCQVSSSLCRPKPGTTVTQTLTLSATEKEITRTRLSLNGGNIPTEEDTLRKSLTELVHRACASSATASHGSYSATAKFVGFDIGPDSISTLEKIWQKHGNIVGNCAVRNTKIIGKALESLATMVHILDDSTALSLSSSQADYLVSTLSDLRYMRFKVDWLIPFVESAEKLHKSKPLVESLNNLNQLSSQAMERRAVLLDELSKLDVEENKRKEEMAKVSKLIPFCGQVKFDKPLGPGLT